MYAQHVLGLCDQQRFMFYEKSVWLKEMVGNVCQDKFIQLMIINQTQIIQSDQAC